MGSISRGGDGKRFSRTMRAAGLIVGLISLASARPYPEAPLSTTDEAFGPTVSFHPQPQQNQGYTQSSDQSTLQQQLPQQQQQQQQLQLQIPTQTYAVPTNQLLQGVPLQAYGQPPVSYGINPSVAQGPVIESLTDGQNNLFTSLNPNSPDMFYFSPKDQVLYRVSRVPLDSANGNALAAGAISLPAGGDLNTVTSGEATTTTTPAPATTTAASIIPPATNASASAPYGIEFEIEEETGGDYVGGFGATERPFGSLAPTASAPVAAPVASGAGAGAGGSATLGSNAGNNDLLNQLILNALGQSPSQSFGDFQSSDQSSSGDLTDGSFDNGNYNSGTGSYNNGNYNSGAGSYNNGNYNSGQTSGGYSSGEPSGLYGAPTEQLSSVLAPPRATLRLSPALARYLQQLQQQQQQRQQTSNNIVPSSSLPENLDAATGTPGGERRRQRKRMNFKAGGAIG